MADDIKPAAPVAEPAPESKLTPAAPKARKYTYLGKAYANPKVKLTIGDITLRPWAMSDEDIDKLLVKHPQLQKLWKTG